MRIIFGVLPAVLALAGSLGGVRAQEKADPPAEHREHYPFITDAENRLIQDYYRHGSGHTPPGATKKGAVPPLLARQLHLGGTIPSGMESKLEHLPDDLDRKLIPVPAGYLRRVCGMTVLLILEKNNLVVDTVEIVRL